MASCCPCASSSGVGATAQSRLPLICLVPREDGQVSRPGGGAANTRPVSGPTTRTDFQLLDDEYIKKHFKLPPRALYLDPFRRPLITFPMSQDTSKNFTVQKKYKINQQILDGFLDASEAISAPSIFPYAKSEAEKRKEVEEEEEIIYILQLPDYEFQCPVHNETIKTPRFIWHTCKKTSKNSEAKLKRGGGPMNKPKPWLLSRHTDFDLLSQW